MRAKARDEDTGRGIRRIDQETTDGAVFDTLPMMPDMDQFEKMNQDLTRMMPKEMASAVNLFAHPVASAAAMSALGFGLANHAFGVWMGALSGAAEASQRLFQPIVDDFEARSEQFADAAESASKARKATKTLIAEAQTFARDVTDIAANTVEKAQEQCRRRYGAEAMRRPG